MKNSDEYDNLSHVLIYLRVFAVIIPIFTSFYFSVSVEEIGDGLVGFRDYLQTLGFSGSDSKIDYNINPHALTFVTLAVLTGILILIHTLLDDRLDSLRTKKIAELGTLIPSFDVIRELPQIINDLRSSIKVSAVPLKGGQVNVNDERDILDLNSQYVKFFKGYLKSLKEVTEVFFKLNNTPIRLSLMIFLGDENREAMRYITNNGDIEKTRVVYPKASTEARLGFMFLPKELVTEPTNKLEKKYWHTSTDQEYNTAIYISKQVDSEEEVDGIYKVMRYGFSYVNDANELEDMYTKEVNNGLKNDYFFKEKHNKTKSFASIRLDTIDDEGIPDLVGAINIESPIEGFIQDVSEYHSTFHAIFTALSSHLTETILDYKGFILKNSLKLKDT